MKDRQQFLKYAKIWACTWVFGMVMFGIGKFTADIEWLAGIFALLGTISMLFPVGLGFYSGVYAILQFRNAYKAYQAGEDYEVYKTRIHYSLAFAMPLGGLGFSPLGVALAAFLVWMLYKWARPIYDWNEMKDVLLHRNGISWKHTALTWVNVMFFVLVAVIPLVILGIVIGILYLIGKSGIVNGLFNMVTNTMGGAGSSNDDVSLGHHCSECAYYQDGFCNLKAAATYPDSIACGRFY